MNGHGQYAQAIATLRTELQKQEQAVRETKRVINKLSVLDGDAMPFPDAETDSGLQATLGAMRRDEFYGQPLATAIRKYLEMRRASGQGPASVNDMYAALCQGGFKFETKNEDNAKRGLYISLAKNAVVFHKLPGGTNEAAVFGLTEWYPGAKTAEKPGKSARKTRRRAADIPKTKKAKGGPALLPPGDGEKHATSPGKKPEKGASHEEGKGAGSAAR